MKICIASVALSLFFGASASAKGWNSRILSIYESFDDERRSLRGNTAKDKSYLEREEENILKEEEALLENILEKLTSEEGNSQRNNDDRNNDDDDDKDDNRNKRDHDDSGDNRKKRDHDDSGDNRKKRDHDDSGDNRKKRDHDDSGDNRKKRDHDDSGDNRKKRDHDDSGDNGSNGKNNNGKNNYEGCYRDGAHNQDRNLEKKVNPNGFLTVDTCKEKCENEVMELAGIAASGQECWCGDRNNNGKANARDCKYISAHGGPSGGTGFISVYRV